MMRRAFRVGPFRFLDLSDRLSRDVEMHGAKSLRRQGSFNSR